MTLLGVALIVALACVVWPTVGYPVALLLFTASGRNVKSGAGRELPPVTMFIPTYNESASIGKKIENVRSLQYPREKLQVIVVDSASTDDTVGIARRSDPNVEIVQESSKMGKAHAINTALPHARNEIVVITDANASMSQNALREIVAAFDDPAVGAATGAMRQVDRSSNAVSEGGGLYWKMEIFMRSREARLHSVIGMSGELSAFRKSLFMDERRQPVAWYKRGGTDDFEMSLFVIRHGFRVGYATGAEVWEFAPDTTADLYRQKVRIIVQTIVSVFRNLDIVFRSGMYGLFIFTSRKLLPLFVPWAMILLLAGSAVLAPSSMWWRWALGAQLLAYALALLGLGPLKRVPAAKLSLFFVLLNGTVLLAWIELLRGRDYTSWTPIQSSRRS